MKQKAFVLEIITSAEFESVIIRDPRGSLLFAGNADDAIEFLAKSFSDLKNAPAHE